MVLLKSCSVGECQLGHSTGHSVQAGAELVKTF